MVLVPVVCCFKSESALLKARCVEVKRFVVHLGIHLVDDFLRFRSSGKWAGSRDGVTASFCVDGLVVGDTCLAVIFQALTFEFFLRHIIVSWSAEA